MERRLGLEGFLFQRYKALLYIVCIVYFTDPIVPNREEFVQELVHPVFIVQFTNYHASEKVYSPNLVEE